MSQHPIQQLNQAALLPNVLTIMEKWQVHLNTNTATVKSVIISPAIPSLCPTYQRPILTLTKIGPHLWLIPISWHIMESHCIYMALILLNTLKDGKRPSSHDRGISVRTFTKFFVWMSQHFTAVSHAWCIPSVTSTAKTYETQSDSDIPIYVLHKVRLCKTRVDSNLYQESYANSCTFIATDSFQLETFFLFIMTIASQTHNNEKGESMNNWWGWVNFELVSRQTKRLIEIIYRFMNTYWWFVLISVLYRLLLGPEASPTLFLFCECTFEAF